MSKFQIITLAVFVICIIAGVAAFALYRGGKATSSLPPITVWGTFPGSTFNQYVSDIDSTLSQGVSVTYVQKDPATFSADFVKALATGQGPDAILIPADMILPEENKLTLIPYSAFPQRNFMDTYIQEANIYLGTNGILGIPFTVDPLMMYWNRDTYNAAGIATYPKTWDEFTGLNKKLTTTDQNGNVRKTAVALGDFTNITNAREVLGSLILQSGNPVTTITSNGVVSTLKTSAAKSPIPALQFFTESVNPQDPNYSWNRGMPNDKSAFLSGLLATYFGFASELADIRAKNPNLNFDVAPLPQLASGGLKATYGRMYGFSLVRASPNANAALQIISTLISPQYLAKLSQTMYGPTVRTDLIAQGSSDPYISVFDQAALVSKTWLDADPAQSDKIFGDLVQAITSGQKTINDALQNAGDQYDVVLKQATQ
jgi:multiple sugar transport system substrate-binding protein